MQSLCIHRINLFTMNLPLLIDRVKPLLCCAGKVVQAWKVDKHVERIFLWSNMLSSAINPHPLELNVLHGAIQNCPWPLVVSIGLFLNGQGVIASEQHNVLMSASQLGTHWPMKSCDYHGVT